MDNVPMTVTGGGPLGGTARVRINGSILLGDRAEKGRPNILQHYYFQ